MLPQLRDAILYLTQKKKHRDTELPSSNWAPSESWLSEESLRELAAVVCFYRKYVTMPKQTALYLQFNGNFKVNHFTVVTVTLVCMVMRVAAS